MLIIVDSNDMTIRLLIINSSHPTGSQKFLKIDSRVIEFSIIML